MSALKWVGY
jgi:hypothetical protein